MYEVAVVIGASFEELERLSCRMPVWAPDLPQYRVVAEEAWASSQQGGERREITLYKVYPEEDSEETFLSWLGTIDEHHGKYSHNPPWSALEVHGVANSEKITEALHEYGVTEISALSDGFRASRPDSISSS